VTYHLREDGSGRAEMSFEELKNASPENVKATVTFPGNETFIKSVPVRVEKQESADLLAGSSYSLKNSSQSWSSKLDVLSVKPGFNASSNITEIQYSSNGSFTTYFTGYVRIPTPCHTLEHQIVRDGENYDFHIWAEKENENTTCSQQVAAARYKAVFQAKDTYKLEAIYGDFDRMMDHPGVEKSEEEQKNDSTEEEGLLGFVLGLLGL
jgi:hypothetical protein